MLIDTRPDYPPEFDGPDYCLVCGKWVGAGLSAEECACPECPVCSEVGDPECFGTHVAALSQNYEWTVRWDNEHACDTLGTFDTREAAVAAGSDWLVQMFGIDTDPAEAEAAYSFEVLEPQEVPNTPEQIKEASSVLL
jgi:hypothetical protein